MIIIRFMRIAVRGAVYSLKQAIFLYAKDKSKTYILTAQEVVLETVSGRLEVRTGKTVHMCSIINVNFDGPENI